MTDLERALAAGGKTAAAPAETDLDRAMKAGGKQVAPSQYIPPQGPDRSFADRAKFAMAHPLDSLNEEAQVVGTHVGNALDTATLGLYRKGRHLIENAIDPQATAQAEETERGVNERHPFAAGVSSGTGYMIPYGGPAMLAESAAAGLGRVASRAPQAIARVLTARPVAGALVGGTVGGAGQVAQDVSNGAPLDSEEAKRALRAAEIGAALGGGAGTVGTVGSAAARAIRNPKTLIGRTIADAESAGGRIRMAGEPVRGGVYETPEMQALPEGKEGYNQLAYEEGQRITAHNEAKLANARKGYGQQLGEHLAANGDDLHFVVDTHNLLDRLADENTINGVTGDPHLANAIEKTRQMLTKEIPMARPPETPRGEPVHDDAYWREANRDWNGVHGHTTQGEATDVGARRPDPFQTRQQEFKQLEAAYAPTEPQAQLPVKSTVNSARQGLPQTENWPAVNVPDLIKTKRIVDGLAEHGMPATPENRPYRMIAGSLARELEAVDPRIAQLNKRYAGTMSDLERANDVIYGSDRAEVPTRAAKERRAAGFLGRIGDDTQAGTIAAPQLRELAEGDPAYARAFERVKAKKAQERLRYGYPEISTNIEKAGHSFIRQNLDAAKARVALPLAEAAGRIGPSPLSMMYLPEAVRRAQEAKRRLERR